MKPFYEEAQLYSNYPPEPKVFYLHLIGSFFLFFSLIIFLGFFHVVVPGIFDIKFADFAVLALLIYYFRFSWQLALLLLPVFIILLLLAHFINASGPTAFAVWFFVITLIVGIVAQFMAHSYTHRKPTFREYLELNLYAPLFLSAELFFKLGWMQDLKAKMYPVVNGNREAIQDSTTTS